MEVSRFAMFFAISLMLDFVGQTCGLCVGAWFDVVVSIYLINPQCVGKNVTMTQKHFSNF